MSLLRSPWVSGGLAAVALGFVAYQVLPSVRPGVRVIRVASAVPPPSAAQPIAAAPPNPASPLPTPSSQTVMTGATPIDRQFVQSRLGEWIEAPKRDPFFRGVTNVAPVRPSPVPGWKLSAIWRQTGSRVATINGAIYQEGDEIEGYKIERIEGDQVWFRGPTGSEPLGFTIRPTETNALPKSTNSDSPPGPTNQPYRKLPLIEK